MPQKHCWILLLGTKRESFVWLSEISGIDFGTICWLDNLLTKRSQRTCVNDTLSKVLMHSAESPQGCVLSLLLFVMPTTDSQSLSQDSSLNLISSCQPPSPPLHDHATWIKWCHSSYLQLKADLRLIANLYHGTSCREMQYRYPETILDDIMTCVIAACDVSKSHCSPFAKRLIRYIEKFKHWHCSWKYLNYFVLSHL